MHKQVLISIIFLYRLCTTDIQECSDAVEQLENTEVAFIKLGIFYGDGYEKQFFVPRHYQAQSKQAKKICEAHGLELAILQTKDEYRELRRLLKLNPGYLTEYVTIEGASFKSIRQSSLERKIIKNVLEGFWTLGPENKYRLNYELSPGSTNFKKFICQKKYERYKYLNEQFHEEPAKSTLETRTLFQDVPIFSKFFERHDKLSDVLCSNFSDNPLNVAFCTSENEYKEIKKKMVQTESKFKLLRNDIRTSYKNDTLKLDFCMTVQESIQSCSYADEKIETYCNQLHILFFDCLSHLNETEQKSTEISSYKQEIEIRNACNRLLEKIGKALIFFFESTEIFLNTTNEFVKCFHSYECQAQRKLQLLFELGTSGVIFFCNLLVIIAAICFIISLTTLTPLLPVCGVKLALAGFICGLIIINVPSNTKYSYIDNPYFNERTKTMSPFLCNELKACESFKENDKVKENCNFINEFCLNFIEKNHINSKLMTFHDQPTNDPQINYLVPIFDDSQKIDAYCNLFCQIIKECIDKYCKNSYINHLHNVFCMAFNLLIEKCKKLEVVPVKKRSNVNYFQMDVSKRFGPPKITTKKPTTSNPVGQQISFCEQVFIYNNNCEKKPITDLCTTVKVLNDLCIKLDTRNESNEFKPTHYDLFLKDLAKKETINLSKTLDDITFLYEDSYSKYSKDGATIIDVEMPNQYYDLLRKADSNYEQLQLTCRLIELYYKKRTCESFDSVCCLLRPTLSLIVKNCRKYINYEILEQKSLIKLNDPNLYVYKKFCDAFSSESHCQSFNPKECLLNKNGCVQFLVNQVIQYVFNLEP